MSEINYLNFFATTAFISGYTIYYFFKSTKNKFVNNIKEIEALKIRVNRIVYCHEQALTKINCLENKINSLINNKTTSVDKETLTDNEFSTDKEYSIVNECSTDKEDSINIDNWTCMDKSIHVNDAYKELQTELFITIPQPKSWLQQLYS
jgi:hypothetical protein